MSPGMHASLPVPLLSMQAEHICSLRWARMRMRCIAPSHSLRRARAPDASQATSGLECARIWPCRTRRFLRDIDRPRPPGWGKSGFAGFLDFGWVRVVLAYTEEEVLQVAGWDAVVYLRILTFGERHDGKGHCLHMRSSVCARTPLWPLIVSARGRTERLRVRQGPLCSRSCSCGASSSSCRPMPEGCELWSTWAPSSAYPHFTGRSGALGH
jgi:hypothetical protein